jgi:Spy/CpxP family protein refolding chaperone
MVRITLLAVIGAALCLAQAAFAAPAEKAHAKERPVFPRLMQVAKALDLTDAQKKQARELFKATHEQVLAVLTDEQKAKLEAAKAEAAKGEAGKRKKGQVRDRLEDLNLTDEQKTKIKAIHEKAIEDFKAILTDEQKKKLDELLAEKPKAREGREGRKQEK